MELVDPSQRPYQPGNLVRSNKLLGVFVVISYTNRTKTSTVFVKSTTSDDTYDVPEDSLSLTNT